MVIWKKCVRFWNNYSYTIITVLVVLGCVIYYNYNPSKYLIMPKCPVKVLTTLDCPGCGFQRALHATLHGHFGEAIHYNLFLLVAVPFTCLWLINGIIIERITKWQSKMRLILLNRVLIYTYIACYFCWFLIRNIYKY